MPVLSNQRHELFAQALAEGMSATAAYESAGYSPNDGNATRLKGNDRIGQRVAELQTAVAKQVEMTAADIARMLIEDRAFAYKNAVPSAAIAATNSLGKLFGLIVDRSENKHDVNLSVLRGWLAQVD